MTTAHWFRTHPAGTAALLLILSGSCANAIVYPAGITGESQTVIVRGEYAPVAIDRVDSLSIADAQLVIHGSTTTAAVALPAEADTSQPTRHWALITDRDTGRVRAVTFTHDQSLDDFTIELPQSEADIRYGVFTGRSGGEVMVFAWGSGAQCFYGWVTIRPRSPSGD